MKDGFNKKAYAKYVEEHNTDNYMGIIECDNGHLYRIHARNANFGIYNSYSKAFIIRRTKFYDTFCFEEIHWDASKDFGTAKPLKHIEKSPFVPNNEKHKFYKENEVKILEYLEKFETEYDKELETL